MKNKFLIVMLFLAVLASALSFFVYSSIEKQERARFEQERRNRISTASSFFGARLANVYSQLEFMEEVFVPPGDGKIDEIELRKIFERLVLVAPSAILVALDTGKDDDMLVVKKDNVETSEATRLLHAKLADLRRGGKHGISFSATPEHQYMLAALALKGRSHGGCLVAIMDIGEALKMSLVFAGNQPFSLLATDGRLLYSSNFKDQIGKNIRGSSIPQLKLFADVLPAIPDDFGAKQTLEVQFHSTEKYGLDGFVLWSNVLTKAENDLVLIAYRPISLVSASLLTLRNWILFLTFVFLVIPSILLARSYVRKTHEVLRAREVLGVFTDITGDSCWDLEFLSGKMTLSPNGLRLVGETQNPVKLEKIFEKIHPDDVETLKNELRRIQGRETDILDAELRVKVPSGGYKWLLERGRVVEHSKQGVPLYLAGVGSDIDEYKKESMVDMLTKIWNRRYFERKMDEESARIGRNGGSACICLGDVGEFKKVNDTFGHEAGDDVLKTIAKAISETIRETDTAARLGGDEFVILFLNMDEEGVAHTLGRIQEAIDAAEVYGTKPDGKKEKISIHIDFGIKFYPDGTSKNLSQAMKLADEAMYEKKQARKRAQGIPPR